MEQKKNLTLSGISGMNFLFIINAVAMIGVSIYLSTHFYDTLFPTQLGASNSLCNLSSFFNCDGATYSKAAQLFGVPTAFFGAIVGLFFLFTSLMPSEAMEKTASAVAKYNLIGCVILFIFSLTVLGSLCPFCTVYYILSAVAFALMWKFGINSWVPDVKVSGIWAGILLVGAFFMHQTTASKAEVKGKLNESIVGQFRSLPNLGEPDVESPYKIHSVTDAPIRISVFSDFECPFCKVVAEQMPKLVRRYPNQISIQYFFFPLDSKCNSNIKGQFHESACDAAMLAACDEKKFAEVHDDIFANQEGFKTGILVELAKKHGLDGCIGKEENKTKVISMINQATKYSIKSTPTIIVNGKKIEGTIPNEQFFAIFEDILSSK